MSGNYFTDPVEFLITTLASLYILALMLRLVLGWVRADFYNPVSQFLVKITNPVLVPLRRFLPPIGRIDTASVVVMLLLQMGALALVQVLRGASLSPWLLFGWSLVELVSLTFTVFIYAIIIQAILSWVSPGAYNPVSSVLFSITEPVLRPIRRLLPPVHGFDLSPLVAIIGLVVLQKLTLPILALPFAG